MKEDKKEIAELINDSVVRTAFSFIPIIGAGLTELYDFSSNLKQARLNKFVLKLQEFMETVDENTINTDYIQTEDFHDIFESILQHVARTKSDEKLERFKNIVVKQLQSLQPFDEIETYINITSRLTDKHIEVLTAYDNIRELQEKQERTINLKKAEIESLTKDLDKTNLSKNSRYKIRSMSEDINKVMEDAEREIEIAEDIYYNQLPKDINHEQLGLTEHQFYLILNELVSMFLLESYGSTTSLTFSSVKVYSITSHGEAYLNFIKEQ